MTVDILKRLILMIGLVLLQVLILNHIHLFNTITPLLYVFLPLQFGNNMPRWAALLWCFCTGLLIDIFSNTPGVAAASMTLIGFIQSVVLSMFVPKEEEEDFHPTLHAMGWLKSLAYTSIICLVYCLAFFSLEAFTFFNIIIWAESVLGSALLTLIIILALAKIRE